MKAGRNAIRWCMMLAVLCFGVARAPLAHAAVADTMWVHHYRAGLRAHAAHDERTFRSELLQVRAELGANSGLSPLSHRRSVRIQAEAVEGSVMSTFPGFSREQLRALYVEAWSKTRRSVPVSPMEALIGDVVALHPEYHALLEQLIVAQEFEAPSTDTAQNPFLHMGLHLAVREQISIDRPPGIRALSQKLQKTLGSHHWEHALMQTLGDILWEAQRKGIAPDENQYLDRAQRLSQG